MKTMITKQIWGYFVVCSVSELSKGGFETLVQAKKYQKEILKATK